MSAKEDTSSSQRTYTCNINTTGMAFASLLHEAGQLSYLQHCSLQGAFPTKRTMPTDESFKNCPALANLYCCNVFKSPCAICEFPSLPVADESNSYFYCTRSIPR